MNRNGAPLRFRYQLEQERRAREIQAQIHELQTYWRVFSFPVQEELHLHMIRFGLHAAEHATHLLERMMQERPHGALALSSHSLMSEQSVQHYGWSDFSPEIQRCLFSHVTTFTHQGDWGQAKRDIHRATALLRTLLSNPQHPIRALLSEHLAAFGVSSAADVAGITACLTFLLAQAER